MTRGPSMRMAMVGNGVYEYQLWSSVVRLMDLVTSLTVLPLHLMSMYYDRLLRGWMSRMCYGCRRLLGGVTKQRYRM